MRKNYCGTLLGEGNQQLLAVNHADEFGREERIVADVGGKVGDDEALLNPHADSLAALLDCADEPRVRGSPRVLRAKYLVCREFG